MKKQFRIIKYRRNDAYHWHVEERVRGWIFWGKWTFVCFCATEEKALAVVNNRRSDAPYIVSQHYYDENGQRIYDDAW